MRTGSKLVGFSNLKPGDVHIELPPKDTIRWVASRKNAVLQAIGSGQITQEDALKRWNLSVEELEEWAASFSKGGENGLKVTKRAK